MPTGTLATIDVAPGVATAFPAGRRSPGWPAVSQAMVGYTWSPTARAVQVSPVHAVVSFTRWVRQDESRAPLWTPGRQNLSRTSLDSRGGWRRSVGR